jgi:hypothetical protein
MSTNATSNRAASTGHLRKARKPPVEHVDHGPAMTPPKSGPTPTANGVHAATGSKVSAAGNAQSGSSTRSSKPVLAVQFSHRVMMNFQMSSRLLGPLMPYGVELMPFRSAYYITLMASNISGVKFWGLPIFPSFNVISLRTYVRATENPDVVGTFTLRRFVSSSAGAWLLRKHLGVSATVLPIKQDFKSAKNTALPSVGYGWTVKDAENKLSVKTRSQVSAATENSKNRWMLGHINEISVSKKSVSVMKTIKPNCKTYDVSKANFKCSTLRMFGEAFVKPLGKRPSSVYLSTGGTTKFFSSQKI